MPQKTTQHIAHKGCNAGEQACTAHSQGKCNGSCCTCIAVCLQKFLPLTVLEAQAYLFAPAVKKGVLGYPVFFTGADKKGLRLPPKIS